MAKSIYLTIVIGLAGLVAGCSGGSGGSTETPPLGNFEALRREANALIASSPEEFTDPSTLPNDGTATYNGVLGLTAEGLPVVLGELSLDVDFEGIDPVSGRVVNFVTDQEERVSGSLVVSNGILDREAVIGINPTLSFDLDGTLRDSAGTPYLIDGYGLGDFGGVNYSHVGGLVGGSVSSGEIYSGINGAFLAAR